MSRFRAVFANRHVVLPIIHVSSAVPITALRSTSRRICGSVSWRWFGTKARQL